LTRPILVSCGEASGDLYCSELVRELQKMDESVSCFGLAGGLSSRAGVELLVTLDRVSVIGLVEVVAKLPALRRALSTLVEAAARRRPAAAVLIDFSGFNLRLARRLKPLGIPIVYYVSPQVWAWRAGRIDTISETVEKMLVILPFEEALYRSRGVSVRFVGHPLVDLVRSREQRAAFLERVGLDPERKLIAVMPGSRRREIELHLPILLRALERLAAARDDLQFLILKAPTVDADRLTAGLSGLPAARGRVKLVEGATYEGLTHAAVAIVASGTATVEAALTGTPMVVVYRVGKLSYLLGKPLVKVAHYAMVNLIAERALVPELIQEQMTAERVAEEVLRLLEPAAAEAMRRGLAEVKTKLGAGGASRRAAEEVLSVAAAAAADRN
jgi:lipid-A-disaccharide synthase